MTGLQADLVAPPFYAPVAGELDIFAAAARRGLPIMLKGPTGCGKTRLAKRSAG